MRIDPERLAHSCAGQYIACVSRPDSSQQDVYRIPLRQRLPKIAVPLAPEAADVPLDLQAVFTRCWNEGPYAALLRYERPPPGKLSDADLAWCQEQLKKAGFRG